MEMNTCLLHNPTTTTYKCTKLHFFPWLQRLLILLAILLTNNFKTSLLGPIFGPFDLLKKKVGGIFVGPSPLVFFLKFLEELLVFSFS